MAPPQPTCARAAVAAIPETRAPGEGVLRQSGYRARPYGAGRRPRCTQIGGCGRAGTTIVRPDEDATATTATSGCRGTLASMPKQVGRPNAESSQETRRKLLAAGAREFFSNPAYSNPFRGLTVDQIARLAGVHRNTVYLHWEDKDAYLADLTRYLLGDPKLFEKEMEEVQEVAKHSGSLSVLDALCAVASKDVTTLQNNDVWRAMEVLAVGYMPLRTELHNVARDGYDAVDDEIYSMYAIVLDRHDRRPRPPFTTASVGKVLQALVEGAGIRQIFDNDCFVDPVDPSSQHGVYAYAVVAVLSVLTTGPRDSRSLDELLRDLLDIEDVTASE